MFQIWHNISDWRSLYPLHELCLDLPRGFWIIHVHTEPWHVFSICPCKNYAHPCLSVWRALFLSPPLSLVFYAFQWERKWPISFTSQTDVKNLQTAGLLRQTSNRPNRQRARLPLLPCDISRGAKHCVSWLQLHHSAVTNCLRLSHWLETGMQSTTAAAYKQSFCYAESIMLLSLSLFLSLTQKGETTDKWKGKGDASVRPQNQLWANGCRWKLTVWANSILCSASHSS